jgi:hypothetical protein
MKPTNFIYFDRGFKQVEKALPIAFDKTTPASLGS